MPIFDFKCTVCGERLDNRSLPSYSRPQDGSLAWPKHCGQEMEKLWSSSNFNIKGYAESNGYSRKEGK